MKGSKQSAQAEAGDHSADEHDNLTWRRVHPLTPLANTWKVIATLFAVVIWKNADRIGEAIEDGTMTLDNVTEFLPYVGLGLAGIALVVGLYSWIAWKRMSFAIGDQAVWFRKGIISRSERHSRLDRIQSVDITHPLIGRVFGLGNLNITVAGGSDSTLTIGLLTSTLMSEVQQEIMDRVYRASQPAQADQPNEDAAEVLGSDGGMPTADAADAYHPNANEAGATDLAHASTIPTKTTEQGNPNDGAASTNGQTHVAEPHQSHSKAAMRRDHPHIPVFEVPTSRLLGSIAFSNFLFSLVWFVIALTLVIVLFRYFEEASLVAVVTSVGTLVIGFVSSFWSKLSKEFGFRAELSADGIHVKHGLTATVAETIPPRRIHAVEIKQSWLWRRFGWYRVEMTVAGKSVKEMLESSTLLPVGTLQEALLAVWLVEPDLGVADPAHMMTVAMGPDDAATVLAAAQTADGTQPTPQFNSTQPDSADGVTIAASNQRTLTMLTSPEQAKVFDPFTWQRNATLLTDTVLMHRGGWLTRYISVIPLGHVQSWEWHQGPWERKRGLARIQPNLVMGSVTVDSAHLEQSASQNLMQDLSRASEQAREGESRADWSNRIQALKG